MAENFDRQLKAIKETQRAEMEEKRNLYSQKMLADATAYQNMQSSKNSEEIEVQQAAMNSADAHQQKIEKMQLEHNKMMLSRRAALEELK